MNTKATAAGVAALINKAQQLHRQSDVLIKQAQAECKHPAKHTTSYAYTPSGQDGYAYSCPDCGKRWVE